MIVQAVESRPQPSVSLMPGTVASVGATVDVVMDGDADGVVVQAAPLFADLSVADRVMVLFDPPRGVFVVGTIGRAHEAGTVILRADFEELSVNASTTYNLDPVTLYAGRRYVLATELSSYPILFTAAGTLVADELTVEYRLQPDGVLLATGLSALRYNNESLNNYRTFLWEPTQTLAVPLEVRAGVYSSDPDFRGDFQAAVTITDVGPA
jgi:hypothetical protein